MNVEQLMTRDVKTCGLYDSLSDAARIIWENDCGCVPVVEDDRVVGMVTDRDICMATYTQGRSLSEMQVNGVLSNAHTCGRDDPIGAAEQLMRTHQVRRLPVVDGEGDLVGMLSVNDILREAARGRARRAKRDITGEDIVQMLGAICAPRSPSAPLGRTGSSATGRQQP